jgi:hypothetical protein
MASKVFISWGGNLSKQLAEEVKNWLPSVLQFVKPYFTPDDIEKGTRWESSIAQELASSQIGIICLTKDNINRPWILFEAGALSKNFGKANVCTVLFNVESTDITGPLTCFQATKFDKADFKKLIKTINETGGDSKLDSKVLDDVFEMWWPRLEDKIKTIIKNYKEESHEGERSERELLEELLELTRMTARKMPRRNENGRHALEIIMRGIERFTMMIDESDKKTFMFLRECFMEDIFPSLEILCMEFGSSIHYEHLRDIRNRFIHSVK